MITKSKVWSKSRNDEQKVPCKEGACFRTGAHLICPSQFSPSNALTQVPRESHLCARQGAQALAPQGCFVLSWKRNLILRVDKKQSNEDNALLSFSLLWLHPCLGQTSSRLQGVNWVQISVFTSLEFILNLLKKKSNPFSYENYPHLSINRLNLLNCVRCCWFTNLI